MSFFLNLWRWRKLVGGLARRDFDARYRSSALGFAWTVLEPAVQFGLYLVAFSLLLGTRLAQTPSMAPFGLFVISGLVPFWVFQEVLSRSAGVVRESAALVRHVRLPLEVLLASAVLSTLARNAVAFLLVLVVAFFLGTVSMAGLPWVLVGVLVLVTISLGSGLVAMVLTGFVPDVARLVGVIGNVVFFASPVAYPLTAVLPERYREVAYVNPFVGMLDAFRCGLLGSAPPPLGGVVLMVGWAAVLMLAGLALYRARGEQLRDLA
jgi:lipopolysaccharide transport system permease protein